MKTWAFLTALAISQLNVAYCKTTEFNATFDTLVGLPEEGRLSPVGIYLNISFPSFDISDPALAVAGVLPESKPNDVFGAGTASSPAEMTISYPGSKVKSLALTSTYYGCETNLRQAAASIPQNCTITATGYKAGVSNTVVAVRVFTYTVPELVTTAPLAFGTFGSAFTDLQTVTFVSEPANLDFHLDNIVGTKVT